MIVFYKPSNWVACVGKYTQTFLRIPGVQRLNDTQFMWHVLLHKLCPSARFQQMTQHIHTHTHTHTYAHTRTHTRTHHFLPPLDRTPPPTSLNRVSVQTAHKYQRYKTESPCFFLSRNTLCPKFARIEENRQHSVSRYIYVTIHLFESKHSHTYLHRYIYMYCCINIQVCYIWVTWNLRMQGMPHFYPWHDAFRCVAWLIPGSMLPSYNHVL